MGEKKSQDVYRQCSIARRLRVLATFDAICNSVGFTLLVLRFFLFDEDSQYA